MNRLLLAALAAAALVSCRHRDFCYDHDDHRYTARALVRADYVLRWEAPDPGQTDWSRHWPADMPMAYADLLPRKPAALRVVAYGGQAPHYSTLPPDGGTLQTAEGPQDLLFINADTEYIVYDGMGAFATAMATTTTRTRQTYRGNSKYTPASRADGERTLSPPDVAFVQRVAGHEARPAAEATELSVTLQPVVHTWVVCFRFAAGLKYVSLARAALAGMAAGVWLNTGTNTREAATLLFDCQKTPWGFIAPVRSFGQPGYPHPDYTRATGQYALSLELALTGGKFLTLEYDITDQIVRQPRGGVVEVRDIEVREEQAVSYGSGFEVDLNGWGQYEDVVMTP